MSQYIKSPTKKTFIIDWPLTLILVALTAISLIAIYGASPLLVSYRDGTDLLIKQVIWVSISVIALVIFIQIGVDRLFTAIDIAYWILMFLLFLLIVDRFINLPFIAPVNGTRAWIQLPGLGTIQPSEFMKAVLIIKSSVIISEHIDQNRMSNIESDIFLFIKILKIAIPPLFLMILQRIMLKRLILVLRRQIRRLQKKHRI